jgi:hypothetical protein
VVHEQRLDATKLTAPVIARIGEGLCGANNARFDAARKR